MMRKKIAEFKRDECVYEFLVFDSETFTQKIEKMTIRESVLKSFKENIKIASPAYVKSYNMQLYEQRGNETV